MGQPSLASWACGARAHSLTSQALLGGGLCVSSPLAVGQEGSSDPAPQNPSPTPEAPAGLGSREQLAEALLGWVLLWKAQTMATTALTCLWGVFQPLGAWVGKGGVVETCVDRTRVSAGTTACSRVLGA